MIINFTKKVRILTGMILTLLIVIGGGVYVYQSKNSVQTSNIEEGKNLNKYIMDVIFDDESKRLMCNQNVEYVNNTNIALDKIYFHIYPNAFSKKEFAPFEKDEMNQAYPNGFNEGYIDIKNVLNNNNKLEYEIKGEKNDLLEVKIGRQLKPGEKISIDMKFNVKIPNSEGRFGYGENTINITNWFPIACVHDDRGWNLKSYEAVGDPFYSDTSNFYVKLLIPRKYKVGCTGNIISEKSDSFSNLFGEYPYDTYSVIASDFYIGGMEYPTLVMIDQSLYNEKDKFLLEYVIAHETAHQWWYSVIGNDEISEPWLDEALTEYSTVLYFEEKYGKEVGSKLIKTMEMQTRNHSSEDIFKATTQYKNSIDYSLNVYTKGALAFNEVRKKVGDEVFFETLKEYYNTYMFQNVNGAKFVDLWNKKGIDIDKIISEYK